MRNPGISARGIYSTLGLESRSVALDVCFHLRAYWHYQLPAVFLQMLLQLRLDMLSIYSALVFLTRS